MKKRSSLSSYLKFILQTLTMVIVDSSKKVKVENAVSFSIAISSAIIVLVVVDVLSHLPDLKNK
jgi:hypothetical protein